MLYKKSDCSKKDLQDIADLINNKDHDINMPSNSVECYTDGSVGADGVTGYGCVMLIKEEYNDPVFSVSFKERLPCKTGSMIAELAAIFRTLAYIKDRWRPDVIDIFCDSKSAIQALQQWEPHDNQELLFNIHHLAWILERRVNDIPQCKLTYRWIPSHIGIIGNELADELAGNVRHLKPIDVGPRPSMSSQFNEMAYKFKMAHQDAVINKARSSKYELSRYLQINPLFQPARVNLKNRAREVVINNLRCMGFTHCTHRCPAKCSRCGAHFSTTHYLTQCPSTPELVAELNCYLTDDETDADDETKAAIILQMAASNQLSFSNIVTRWPIQATCDEGHPLTKNYGRMRVW